MPFDINIGELDNSGNIESVDTAVDKVDAREFSAKDDGVDASDGACDDDNADGEGSGEDKGDTIAEGTSIDDVCDDASATSGMGAFVVGATAERIMVLSTDLAFGIG